MPKPRIPESLSAKEAAKRDAILSSALKLFTERGYEATPVPLIAEQAKIGVGTIYRYFENKEVLVNELYFFWKSRMHNAVRAGFDAVDSYEARFKALCREMSQFGRKHPMPFAFLEIHIHATYLDKRNVKKTNEFVAWVADFITQGIREKKLQATDTDMIMALVYGGLIGTYEAFGANLSEEKIENMLDLMWRMVRA